MGEKIQQFKIMELEVSSIEYYEGQKMFKDILNLVKESFNYISKTDNIHGDVFFVNKNC